MMFCRNFLAIARIWISQPNVIVRWRCVTFSRGMSIVANHLCVFQYFEGQRFIVDKPSSIVPATKLISSGMSTGLSVGIGKPNHRFWNTLFSIPEMLSKCHILNLIVSSFGRAKKYAAGKCPVLCFHAYFKEAVHESPLENFRVHKCDIFYYTDDDSIEVNMTFFSLFLSFPPFQLSWPKESSKQKTTL